MRWFRHDFFRWPEQHPPSIYDPNALCDGNNPGSEGANEEEAVWGAGFTELYKCRATGKVQRFPRYTNVQKLLETRKGRCGEFANCFAAVCRACGYETRHIVDHTDHVWVEIFFKTQNRWVHADPCENTYDAPLLYEAGWGKKLKYIFAFGRDHCLDVSRRYTKDLKTLDRTMFPNEAAVGTIFKIVSSYMEEEDLCT